MRFPAFFAPAVVLVAAVSALADQASTGVDALQPPDVAKAIAALKESFVRPAALADPELQRAMLQGLLDRLGREASLVSGSSVAEAASPFYSELYLGKTGYLRPGALTQDDVAKAADTLEEWAGKGIGAVVLDLRGTPASSDYQSASTLAGLFCPKGTELFSLTGNDTPSTPPSLAATPSMATTPSPGTSPAPATSPGSATSPSPAASSSPSASPTGNVTFTNTGDPAFQGLLVILVDGSTSEGAEAVVGALRQSAKALIVGEQTAGRALQYRDYPLGGQVLRVAVARVALPGGKEAARHGLKPDINAAAGTTAKTDLMRQISAAGVASVVEEHDLPHLNEAALVAGSNPEIDELEAEASGKKLEAGLVDPQLQRALDLVTSISVYNGKKSAKPSN